jgi:hypothetical protein
MSGNRGSDIALAAVITVVFVACQLQASLDVGVLSFPPTYDDIEYYTDAARRLQSLWQGSIGTVLREYIANPPHAPGSTFLAVIGFLLLGIKPWAADAANALPLFLFVLIILRLCRELPFGVRLIVTTASLSIPIFGVAIVEFRPDFWCAGLTVAGTLLIALRDPREFRTAVLAGLAFAVSLLMKPTFAPLVVILFCTALVLRLAPHLVERKDGPTRAITSCLIVGALTLMLAGPHYVLDLHNLIAYYRENVFGANAALWTPQISPLQNALFYLTGPAGAVSLAQWAYVGVLTLAVPIIFSIRRRAQTWPICIVVILTLIAYVTVTAPGNKSAWIGAMFPAYAVAGIILSAVNGLGWLYARNLRRATYFAALALLSFGAYTYRFPSLRVMYPHYVAASRQAVIDDIASVLKSDPALPRKIVAFPQIGQYTNSASLTLKFLQDHTPMPTFAGEFYSDDIARHVALLDRADYVIALTGDYPDKLLWLPSAKITDQVHAMIRERFDLVKTIIASAEPGEVQIYGRRAVSR